ncbi:hypothetical protein INT43_008873 [Umbelopsis isabellina]|uniref:Uncharacterized protein n=1 Tax=Mortierella isabellina TaxID=91625 RepID=A0A8H7PX03_MORIS|nr:hypothetical protein INT43_008873 [Umbelopsis isabellina]
MDETTPLVSKKQQQHWLGIKPSPWVLYPAFIFLGTVLGMVQGPFVQFLLDLLCQRMDTSTVSDRSREECNADSAVQAASSTLLMQTDSRYDILGMLSTVMYSSMSDKRGRRPILIINAFGFLADITLSYILARFHQVAPLWLLVVGAICQGLGGSSATLLMSCHAYAADCTTPGERTVVFGRLMASFVAGNFAGPTLAGYIMEKTGSIEPILIVNMAGLSMWILYLIFVMPESNRKVRENVSEDITEPSQPFWKRLNFYSSLSIIFTASPELANKASLPLLILTQMLSKTANLSFVCIVVLYVTYVFGWTPAQVGYFLSFENAASLIGLLFIIPLITKMHGKVSDEEDVNDPAVAGLHIMKLDLWMVRIGLTCLCGSMLLFSLANVGWVMFLGATLQMGGSLYIVSAKSLLVQLAGEDQAGQILGAAGVVESMVFTFAPILANELYSRFVFTSPWVVFGACTGLHASALFLSIFIRSKRQGSIILYNIPMPTRTFLCHYVAAQKVVNVP